VAVLDEYLAELKAGRAPPREELLARYPQLAEQLSACLAGMEFIHKAAGPQTTPTRLGDFRIVREIGRGGMGAVFEAEQISLGRRVALKILRFGTVSDPEALDRFRREAETVARLHHTNIVPIYSVGNEAGVNYYAMQYIDGKSLDLVLRENGGPLDPLVVARHGLEAAEALAHAHQRGVIHRDVKPSNLMLEEGRIWLTDFGLAKRLDDVTLSMTGALLGTPRYMSPEQAQASKRPIDHRTDIYSLGATLYELATGRPAFVGETPHTVISQILHAEPPSPRSLRPGLPRDLETILVKCLAKEPGQRYASAQELADDLRAFLDGRPIRARRASLVERGVRWLRRERRSVVLTLASIALTVVLLLGGLLGWFGYRRWQIAYLSLDTDTPPLIAEFLGPNDEPLEAVHTLPTQQALEFSAGNYRMRISGEGRLSQTIDVSLRRGGTDRYQLNLEDQLMGPPLRVALWYGLMDFESGTDLLLFSETGFVRRDAAANWDRWSVELAAPNTDLLKAAPGLVWPWRKLLQASTEYSGYEQFDLRPWVVRQAHDLNRDGAADAVIAARHQAWVLAVSGKDGQPLWLAARSKELGTLPQPFQANRADYGVTSTVVSPPGWAGDLDGDRVPDLVAAFDDAGFAGEPGSPAAWVEALSGATGATLWRHDLAPSLFALPSGTDVPWAYKWFHGPEAGWSSSGGGWAAYGNVLKRSTSARTVERSGNHRYAPSAPEIHKIGDKLLVLLTAGQHVVSLDARTGQPEGPPHPLPGLPGRPVRWVDGDGDGVVELVYIDEVAPFAGAAAPPSGKKLTRLGVWSLRLRQPLWQKTLTTLFPGPQDWFTPVADWPQVADLDGDGACEVIVPSGSSELLPGSVPYFARPYGELEVVDGRSGMTRWKRRLRTMDQSIDLFVVGPDINADGHREVFAAAIWGRDFELFVDALSGKDGQTLWLGRRNLSRKLWESREEAWLTSLAWSKTGSDGWPQLLVLAAVGDPERRNVLCCFSAGTGRLTATALNIAAVQSADVDHDDLEDMLLFVQGSKGLGLDGGGSLAISRGVAGEPWRRIGGSTKPAADFDLDGVRDLIHSASFGSNAQIEAISGRTGQPLWTSERGTSLSYRGALLSPSAAPVSDAQATDPLSAPSGGDRAPASKAPAVGNAAAAADDLDGDNVRDVLLYRAENSFLQSSPLVALSGRSGRKLWSADIKVRVMQNGASARIRDTDGDGRKEVLLVAPMDLGYEPRAGYGSDEVQLWAALFSGQDGRLIWKSPLSAAYGREAPGYRTEGFPYFLLAGLIAPEVIDVDDDGVLDVVLPAEANADQRQLEMRALSGKDGRVLWRHPLPSLRSSGDVFSSTAPVALADLNGDGRQEVVALQFEDTPGGTRRAHLEPLRAFDGKPLWSWQAEVDYNWGRLDEQAIAAGRRPRPYILRRKSLPPLIALHGMGPQGKTVIIDHQGQQQAEYLAMDSRQRDTLAVCDVDHDGTDELLLPNTVDNHPFLQMIRLDAQGSVLWRRSLAELAYGRVLGVAAAGRGRTGQYLVLLRSTSDPPSIQALDAATGQRVWHCPSPSPRADGSYLPTEVALMSPGAGETPPHVLYRHETQTVCRVGSVASDVTAGRQPSPRLAAALPKQPLIDPRMQRPLPWRLSDSDDWAGGAIFVAWSAGYCASLLLLPGILAWRIIRQRQFGLKTMLALPVVAGVVLLAVLIDGPDNDFQSLMGKFAVSVAGLPVLLALVLFVRWALAGKFVRLSIWLLLTLLVAGIMAAVVLLIVTPVEAGPLEPGERWDPAGWYWIWFPAAYVVAWAMFILLPLWAVIKAAWRCWTKPSARTAAAA
jgi:hypothetical protein